MMNLDDMARDESDILSDAEDFLTSLAEGDESAQANIVLILSQLDILEKVDGQRKYSPAQILIIEKATELREQWQYEEDDEDEDEDEDEGDESDDEVIKSVLNPNA